jgi:DNA repair exonuclease SbcCD ATPase subunit
VARGLAAKASQAVAGFTLSRLTAVSVDDRGNVQVVTGGRTVPAITLPPAERDLVFLALKLALLEQAVATDRTAAILDDVFVNLSDGVRRTAARLLKALARPGQVIHATSDPAFREAADHQA